MLISPQPPAGEEVRVEAVMNAISDLFGKVPEGMKLFALSPEILEQRWAGMQYYLHHPRLSMGLLAFIRLLVSERMQAPFCIGLNIAILQKSGISPGAIDAARRDPALAPLAKEEIGLLQLVLKAVAEPLAVTAHDLEAARQQGWSDRDILDAILHGANNVAADIVFNTFKVDVTAC
ncbi:MAG: hypothetical protein HQL63_07635 [Magnetococcales bacterium]|nr:hypothetical protein [Magnetococcales bacterium]